MTYQKRRKFTTKLVKTDKDKNGGRWAIKMDGITIAKSRKCYAPNWLRRLYKDIEDHHYDTSSEEIKKYVGRFMRKGFSKKKLKDEEFTRIKRKGQYQ